MNNDDVDITFFAHMLYANLLIACPIDYGTMRENITFDEDEEKIIITVSKAKTKKGDYYAVYTTRNWGRRSARKKANYEKKGLYKERQNYRWIEKTIEQTFSSMVGNGGVTSEL